MGYRTYLYSISKEKYEKVKGMTAHELHRFINPDEGEFDPDDAYIGCYDIVDSKLFELGKYDLVETCGGKSAHCKPFFTTKDMMDYYAEDNEFYVVDKRFLKSVIQIYEKAILDYYTNNLSLTGDFREDRQAFTELEGEKLKEYATKLFNHVSSMASEWGGGIVEGMRPYNLDRDDGLMITSWKFEYVQFDLVSLYKTFDFKNNVLVYAGW